MKSLQHLGEFQQALANYQPHSSQQGLLEELPLVLLVAPVSSGRNTIIRHLVSGGGYHFIVSDTTRPPRINDGVLEQNGVEYWFRTEDELLAGLRAGQFLEAKLIHNQQVSGINLQELQIAYKQHEIAITEVEINGADTILQLKPNTTAIFVLPPSFEEWQRRLKHRGAMGPAELQRRLVSALAEFQAALAHDYYKFVINDNFEESTAQIRQIVEQGKIDEAEQIRARHLTEELYQQTKDYLETL